MIGRPSIACCTSAVWLDVSEEAPDVVLELVESQGGVGATGWLAAV
jgi:hypothetical protein